MANKIYETYPIKDPLLPFHFHKENLTPNLDYPNWHDDIELLYCVSEGGYVRCSGTQYRFRNNDIICINPGTLHSSCTDRSFVYYCLIINSDFCKENGIDTSKLYFQTYISDGEFSGKFQKLVNAYEDLENHKSNDELKNIKKATVRLCVMDILVFLSQNYHIGKDAPSSLHEPSTDYTKKVLEYVSSNISQNFTLDEIARYIGITKYHLSREFKLVTGHTIIEQINILKCNEAKKLIESGKSVTEAAIHCGFNTLSYFSQVYKKHMGVSPTKNSEFSLERV